jgi:glycosyltransferase involved in cell wall biosynthesis
LQLLLSNLPRRVTFSIILFEDGAYAAELRSRGIAVDVVVLRRDLMTVQREKLPLGAALAAVGLLPQLIIVFRRLAPDVIYTNTVKAHVLGAVAGRLAGYPVVSHYRDILAGLAREVLRAVSFGCVKQRIAISKAVADSIALPNTVVVPNPLDLSQYRMLPSRTEARQELGLPEDVPIVAIIGRINRWKGHDRFLRIAKLVAEKSEAHFIIVGKAMFRDEDFAEELNGLAATLGISERVHSVPWLADPRVAYAAIDVNCNTSRAEPFGRTIIEAAACGVPTVAFDEGGAPEAIEDGVSGRVVPADDEPAFAEAILELLVGDRIALAAAARNHALLFDAALHAERIAAILDRVVSEKGKDVGARTSSVGSAVL